MTKVPKALSGFSRLSASGMINIFCIALNAPLTEILHFYNIVYDSLQRQTKQQEISLVAL